MLNYLIPSLLTALRNPWAAAIFGSAVVVWAVAAITLSPFAIAGLVVPLGIAAVAVRADRRVLAADAAAFE